MNKWVSIVKSFQVHLFSVYSWVCTWLNQDARRVLQNYQFVTQIFVLHILMHELHFVRTSSWTLVTCDARYGGGGGVLWLRRCKQEVARTWINDIQLHCVSLAKPLIRARSAALQNKHNSEIINPLTYQLGVVSVYTDLHHYFFFFVFC